MVVSIAAQMSVVCPFCNIRNPLPGLRSKLGCHACAGTIDVAAIYQTVKVGGTRYHFGGYYDVLAEAALLISDGEPSSVNAQQAVADTAATFTRALPSCGACQVPLAFDVRAQVSGMLVCSCGEQVALRPADPELREWDPRITCIVGDAKGVDTPMAQAAEGTVIPCGNCGAALAPDGARRTTRCRACNQSNFLGDAAWRKLRPPHEACTLYLVYDVDAATLVALHRELVDDDSDSIGSHYFLDGAVRARLAAELKRLVDGAGPDAVAAGAPRAVGRRVWYFIGAVVAVLVAISIAFAVIAATKPRPTRAPAPTHRRR